MIIYVDNLKESTKKLLTNKQLSQGCKRYKVNIQKSITFLYTSNVHMELKLKTQNQICYDLPQIKYFVIKLTKSM